VRAESSVSAVFNKEKLQRKHSFKVSELPRHYVKLNELKL